MRPLGLPSLSRLSALLLLSGSSALSTGFAHAQESGPEWLTYEAPPECPQAEYIEEKVIAWLKGPVPPDSDLSARGQVLWNAGKWEVTVDLSSGGARGIRRISVDHCVEAAEFVAVTVVLALDPSFVVATEAEDEPEAVGAHGPSLVGEAPESETVTPVASPPKAEEDEPVPPRVPRFITLEAALQGVSGVFPDFAWGATGRLGWRTGIWELAAGLAALPTVGLTQAGAASPIDYSLLSGVLGACARFSGRAVSAGPCLGAWLGRFSTAATDVDGTARETEHFWCSVHAGGQGAIGLGSALELFAGAYFSVPITQPTLVLTDLSPLHQPGPGVLAELGLRLAWPLGSSAR